MENYDVYVAALMKKFLLDEEKRLFLYQVVGFMDDGEMDFSTEMFLCHKTGKEYFAMESEEALFSEIDYLYGFLVSMQDLKTLYFPDSTKDDKELLQEYYNDLNHYVYFGSYDSHLQGVKIIRVSKDAIGDMKREANMDEFGVIYEEGANKSLAALSIPTIDKIQEYLEKGSVKELKSYFTFLKDNAKSEFEKMKEKSEEASKLLELEDSDVEKGASSNLIMDIDTEKKSISSIHVFSAYNEIKKRVIGQDETIKKVLSVMHTNDLVNDTSYRSRCLIVGKTGSGKTEILRNLGKIANRPFVRTDSTQITMAGYVGGSIENNIISPLIVQAGGNIELAQRGIVALDEIDKKGSSSNEDVSGRGVLNSFLPFLDGTQYPMMVGGKKVMFDTSYLTVYASGAFSNVFDYNSKKMRKIGIQRGNEETKNTREIDIEDFIKIGLMPDEFMGRFPIVSFMNELSEYDFETILTKSEASPLAFYEKLFRDNYHISLQYDDNFIKLLAKKAYKHKLGARAIQKITETIFEECRWQIYAGDIHNKELILTEKTVEDPKEFILK